MSDERLVKQAQADWHLAEHWEKRFETTVEERDFYQQQYQRTLRDRDEARTVARQLLLFHATDESGPTNPTVYDLMTTFPWLIGEEED